MCLRTKAKRIGTHWRVGQAIVAALLLAGPPVPSRADNPLTPADLMLVYNEAYPGAAELARYYAKRRGVPMDRLCPLHVPRGEEIGPTDFERRIRQPIRETIIRNGVRDNVRCLVTFYGLPIRIRDIEWPTTYQSLSRRWEAQLASGLEEILKHTRALQTLASSKPPAPPVTTQPSVATYPEILIGYARARNEAHRRVEALLAQGQGAEANRKLVQIVKRVEGVIRLLPQVRAVTEPDDTAGLSNVRELEQQIDDARRKAMRMLRGPLDDPQREQGHALVQSYAGLYGRLEYLRNDVLRLKTEQTSAAVDSELTLLWWEAYPRYRWITNLHCWRVRSNPANEHLVPPGNGDRPVLMVSRIDAPTARIARSMIDSAIQAEHTGLQGNVYLDARGMPADQGMGRFDEALRYLGKRLREHTPLSVELDDNPSVFGVGQCPDAMLYCGWYSLRRYVDAFTFTPGAVGYHIASFEAISLKGEDEKGWCAQLLRDGVSATLGPVGEPYLQAFPLPPDFFGLLLTGRFTLAECYAYSAPFNSWQMMLLGDPLYRPFADRPMLKLRDVFQAGEIPPELRQTQEPIGGANVTNPAPPG